VQGSYIRVPGIPYRYVALDAGRSTVVKRQKAGGGSVVSELRVSGHYGIPGVDFTGSTTGLSADGRTLVLAELSSYGPASPTRLIVLDTRPLAIRARLTLPGWATVDAISPDGRWLYLIQYASSNISRYEVRAYDLTARRFLADPVVDPRDRGEAMTGIPINRVMSAGGRWAYTLYLRPSGVPFLHALDTTGHRAVCIDLPSLSNMNVGSAHLRLGPGGAILRVDTGGVARAVIDTRTFTVGTSGVRAAATPVRPVAQGHPGPGRQSNVAWHLVMLSLVALALVGAAVTGVARSRLHTDEGSRPPRSRATP
jgi:hypothetical protein